MTTVQSAKHDGIFRGRAFATSLGDGLANEVLVAPYTRHFASFDPGSSSQEYPSSLMGSIALVRQTLYDAHWYADAHAAWEPGDDAPEVHRSLAALVANDGPVLFATEDALSLLRAARIADELDLPMAYVGSGREYLWLDEIAALVPEIVLPATLPEKPKVATYEDALDVSLADLRHWERAPANAGVLAGADIPFAFTATGLRDDESFWDNVQRMVEHGLDPETALAALTTVPARLIGVEGRVGTLEPGKNADFVVADGDLFEDGSIVATFTAGQRAWGDEPLAASSIEGVYTLTLDGVAYTVTLEEGEEAEAELAVGGRTIEGKDVSMDGDHARFRATLGGRGASPGSRSSASEAPSSARWRCPTGASRT